MTTIDLLTLANGLDIAIYFIVGGLCMYALYRNAMRNE